MNTVADTFFSHSETKKIELRNKVGSAQVLKTGGRRFDPGLGKYSLRINDSHRDMINLSRNAERCFADAGCFGKKSVAWNCEGCL